MKIAGRTDLGQQHRLVIYDQSIAEDAVKAGRARAARRARHGVEKFLHQRLRPAYSAIMEEEMRDLISISTTYAAQTGHTGCNIRYRLKSTVYQDEWGGDRYECRSVYVHLLLIG